MSEKLVGIPSVDLSEFLSGDENKKQKFINELGNAYESIGFCSGKKSRNQ